MLAVLELDLEDLNFYLSASYKKLNLFLKMCQGLGCGQKKLSI